MQAAQIAATISTITARDAGDNEDPRTELDSHANMLILGAHAFILSLQTVPVMFSPLIQV